MLTLQEIRAEVDRLAAIVGASGYVLPTYGRSDDGGRANIEIDARGYHYVVEERGAELSRVTTADPDDLLCTIFEHVTFSLATTYASRHRVRGREFRRPLFARQIELLAKLSPVWAERGRRHQAAVLAEHPFDDASDDRVRLSQALTKQGYAAADAWVKACERYPLP